MSVWQWMWRLYLYTGSAIAWTLTSGSPLVYVWAGVNALSIAILAGALARCRVQP